MTISQSVTVRRRRLGSALRQYREAAGLTGDEVARRLDMSTSKVSRIEKGLVPTSARDVRDMLHLYGVPEPLTEPLIEIARTSRQRDWWHHFDDVFSRHFSIYLGLEAEATEVHTYEPILVPGLLQTPAYALAVFAESRLGETDEELERKVQARVRRQEALFSRCGPRLSVVIDEAVLHRVVGSVQVMRAQLFRLAEVGQLRDVNVQVVPFRAGAYPAMGFGFITLRFADAGEHTVACLEHYTSSVFLDTPRDVHRYHAAFSHLSAAALDRDRSAELITQVAEGLTD